jgi:transposase
MNPLRNLDRKGGLKKTFTLKKSFTFLYSDDPGVGFLCSEIFEGTISDEQIIEFIDTKVRPLCSPDSVCIIVNAKYHHTHAARGYLEQVLNGKYAFSPACSPHLKPVERAFSLVKTWLREHEEQATQDPVEWLNRAFEHFASGGPGAGSLLGHWDMYFKLRKIYEEENA